MINDNQERKNNFLINFIRKEKIKISNFLANNPEVLAINLAEEMLCFGLPAVYVAAITGVSIYGLNKLQTIMH